MDRSIDTEFTLPLPFDQAIAWCRSAQSRKCWPGVVRVVAERSDLVLSYVVDLAAPGAGAAAASVTIEEHLGPVEAERPRFETNQHWLWPSGAVASCFAVYEFTPTPGGTRCHFEFNYFMGGSLLRELFDDKRFRRSVAHASERYTQCLQSACREWADAHATV